MAGSTLQKARRDAKKYVTKGGFEENIILESADGLTTLATTGFVTKHWINFDTDGLAVNSKNAHITLDEDVLITANYPVRNSDLEVDLRRHKVSTPDSTGINKSYIIIEWFPNETLGLIVCILGDYESN
jgi:hypothetical protein